MQATLMYKAGDVRVENVPDAAIDEPTDALVRVGVPQGERMPHRGWRFTTT